MKEVVVTAVGGDRPGIVAAVTGVLLEAGCNLADTAMSLLRGQFAMMLLVEVPEGASVVSLEEALRPVADRLGLTILVKESVAITEPPPAHPYVLSIYGADHPGIVHRVAKALGDRRVNIVDLVSHLAAGIYTMVLDVQVPEDIDPEQLRLHLEEIAREIDVRLSFRPSEADEL